MAQKTKLGAKQLRHVVPVEIAENLAIASLFASVPGLARECAG